MKILEIVGELNGGVSAVTENYLSRFPDSQDQIDLLAFDDDSPLFSEVKDRYEAMDIRVFPFRHRNQGYLNHFRTFRKLLLANQYDIVHCHFGIWSAPYLSIAKKCRVPVRIAHCHSAKNEYSGWKKWMLMPFKPWLESSVTLRMACGTKAAEILWKNSENVFRLKNAIQTEKFAYSSENRRKIREQYGIQDDEILIGHIGRFCTTKNQIFILQMAAEMQKSEHYRKNFCFFLIGDGEDKPFIDQKIKEQNLQKHVRTVSFSPDPEKWYSAFDLFILPSLYEGIPLVGVEAQCSGLPVIFSNRIDPDSSFRPDNRFLELDANLWIRNIESMMEAENSDLRRQKALEETVRAGYEIENQASKLHSLYAEQLNQARQEAGIYR